MTTHSNLKNKTLLIGYQKEDKYRLAFDDLAMTVFGYWFKQHHLSFETWYQAGFWNENYIPYTLFEDGQAIANVSVNIIDFEMLGTKKRTIQIGTVMTHPDYRNQKLNRLLMERVLTDWSDAASFIYLYANASVLELYPKFGFARAKEYEHFGAVNHTLKLTSRVKPLNMDNKDHQALLYQYIKQSINFSKIAMHENNDLVMFSTIMMLKNNIYYLPEEQLIAIATLDNETLNLLDVFGLQPIELDRLVATLAQPSTKEVIFGFTPIDCDQYQSRPIVGEDTLFIRGEHLDILDKNKLMFPVLSHA